MKKKIVVVVLLLTLAGVVSAQAEEQSSSSGNASVHIVQTGITQGDNMVSFMVGLGAPLGDSGIDVEEGSTPKWGDFGFQYGLSLIHFVNETFGFGFEISGMNAGEADDRYFGTVYGYNYSETYTTSMNLFNVMLTGRLNVNPQNQARIYFPFGLGLTSANGKVGVDGYVSGGGSYVPFHERYTATTSSLGYFIGVGVETNLEESKNWSLGAEFRYSGFTFDTDKLVPNEKLNGKQHYKYLSFLVKLGYRF